MQTCLIPLGEEPTLPELTEVVVDDTQWPMIMDCETEDGWVYSNPYDVIELCGAACDALKQAGSADIDYC